MLLSPRERQELENEIIHAEIARDLAASRFADAVWLHDNGKMTDATHDAIDKAFDTAHDRWKALCEKRDADNRRQPSAWQRNYR